MTETLLLVIIALLTVNILFVGVYIVLVLKEVRQAITKMNQILDSFSTISSAIANPVSSASGFFSAIVEGVKAFHQIQDTVVKHKNKEGDESE
jgi:glucose uptake protein GlcU